MASPYFFPQGYPYQQPVGFQQNYQQTPQQIQNGGFVSVRSRAEAQNYPIAPGNSVTFKDETAPFVYTKTMGFSQLDRPIFEVFRLVKEEDAGGNAVTAQTSENNEQTIKDVDFVKRAEFDALSARIDALESERTSKPKKEKKSDE